ncbi:Hypothetical predicted protein [Cloeon dipterum]|uniref:Ricin B lectin domain-containing protein n=1 Tax=Cloeon dipterum TaxID=197152 RepID=A0A8S1CRF3_9INSE|nr:Hypothetical predicted protein [Cloeon dipterum]
MRCSSGGSAMRWKIAVALLGITLLQVCSVQSTRSPNLCRLSSSQINTLFAAATYPKFVDRSLNAAASTINVPDKVCQKKIDDLKNSIDDLVVNSQICAVGENTACVDTKHEAVKININKLITISERDTREDLRRLQTRVDELHSQIFESLLAEQSFVNIAQSVKSKIQSGNYKDAASFFLKATNSKKLDQYDEIVRSLDLNNEDSKKVLLFIKALEVSPISFNVAQGIAFENFTEPSFLFFHDVVKSAVEHKEFKNQQVYFQRNFRALLGTLIDKKRSVVKNLLTTMESEDFSSILQIETYFAPQKIAALLRDLSTEVMKQDATDAVRQIIKIASNLKDLGNQCIILENAHQIIQRRNEDNSNEAFQMWLYARKTVNEEPDFRAQEIDYRKKCVTVQDDLDQFAAVHINNFVKMYDDRPRSLLGFFYMYPVTMKFFLPDLVEQKYRGQRGSLLKLTAFYYKINRMEDSIIFLKSLVDQLVIYEETNSFESFHIFTELKVIMSLSEYPNAGSIFKKKCNTAKSHMPKWMGELIWKDTASCSLSNRFNGHVLLCSNLSSDDLNSIYTKPPKGNTGEKWKILLEPSNGRLVLQNRQFSTSLLHHGEGLQMPRGTDMGWNGWSNHEGEKWKIEGVPGDFVKLYYADGIYLTGSNRRCNIGYNCVDLKRSTQDHLQQWKLQC